MDALSETLRVVRLIGAIFINGRFTAPWCYQSPKADYAAPFLEPGAERVVIFHMITEGECYVEMQGQAPVHLVAGDAVIFPLGDAHRMASAPGVPAATGAKLDVVLSRRPRQLAYGGGGAVTRLVCGYLACDARLARMLLAGLPPLVKVNVRGSNAGAWLEASLRYALSEARSPRPGGMGVLAKLSDLLPGEGALITRMVAFNQAFAIPRDKLDAVFSAAIAESRARTKQFIDLPDDESFRLEYVTNQVWSGYNWYKGNYRSVIQINTDLKIFIDRDPEPFNNLIYYLRNQ